MIKYEDLCLFLEEKGYDDDTDRIGLLLDVINEQYTIIDIRKDIKEVREYEKDE